MFKSFVAVNFSTFDSRSERSRLLLYGYRKKKLFDRDELNKKLFFEYASGNTNLVQNCQ